MVVDAVLLFAQPEVSDGQQFVEHFGLVVELSAQLLGDLAHFEDGVFEFSGVEQFVGHLEARGDLFPEFGLLGGLFAPVLGAQGV